VSHQAAARPRSLISLFFFSSQIRMQRASWGLFRDRRPELYHPISTLDGTLTHRAAVARDTSAAPAKLLPPLDTPKIRGYEARVDNPNSASFSM
jgi:hypothetical protein